MGNDKAQKTKIAYLELLRIIASFFVIVNHTNSGVFLAKTPERGTWWASVAYFFASKTAVPVFLMISGALMLGKVEENRKHLKRFVRILLDLVIFSVIYSVYYHHVAGLSTTLAEILKRMYQINITNAFWYLYLYLGIIVMLPLFQRLSVNMERNAYRYLIVISVVLIGSMPILVHYVPGAQYNGMFAEPMLSVYVGILFLGYYLAHEVELKPLYAGISVLVFFVGIILQVGLTYLEYCKDSQYYLFYDDRTFLTVTATSAALFYLVRWTGSVIRWEWFWNAVTYMGGCSFGVYLLSDLLIELYAMTYMDLMMRMHALKAVIVYQLLVFATGIVITAILKKIPLIKKLL